MWGGDLPSAICHLASAIIRMREGFSAVRLPDAVDAPLHHMFTWNPAYGI